MIILLDENFPLRFYARLQKEGFSAEHILLTHRGFTIEISSFGLDRKNCYF